MKESLLAELDPPVRARLMTACAYVNLKLEQARNRLRVYALALLFAVLLIWQRFDVDPLVVLAGAVVVYSLLAQRSQRQISVWYKHMVVKRLVDALGGGLVYTPESTLRAEEFESMELFRESLSSWKSEDEVRGERNGVSYALHEVVAMHRAGKSERAFFRGVVVALEFNKNFQGHTVVVPETGIRRPLLSGIRGDKEKVSLHHAEFDRLYAVYSSDQQQAHYVLTPKFLEMVLDARKKLDAELRLAFFRNMLFVTVPLRKDYFEVSFGMRVTPVDAFDALAGIVALATGLIDTLDLETRVWTRV